MTKQNNKLKIKIKREKLICPDCNKEVIKEEWNNGHIDIYEYDLLGISLLSHNCRKVKNG